MSDERLFSDSVPDPHRRKLWVSCLRKEGAFPYIHRSRNPALIHVRTTEEIYAEAKRIFVELLPGFVRLLDQTVSAYLEMKIGRLLMCEPNLRDPPPAPAIAEPSAPEHSPTVETPALVPVASPGGSDTARMDRGPADPVDKTESVAETQTIPEPDQQPPPASDGPVPAPETGRRRRKPARN